MTSPLSSNTLYSLTYINDTICIASPKTLQIKSLGEALGYKHVESHFAFIHRSLTREIAVFEKVQN